MRQFFIFLFFQLFILTLNAQTNYKEGYILTNEKDTIFGWIDYRTDKMNSEVCRFKKEENSDPESFYPGQIKGYRFIKEGKFYISHDIEINNQRKKVFLEFLLQGIMNLYYYSPSGIF